MVVLAASDCQHITFYKGKAMEFINGHFIMEEDVFHDLGDEMLGFCSNCGEEHGDCLEPDARNVTCDYCGQNKVFGLEELLMMGKISFE